MKKIYLYYAALMIECLFVIAILEKFRTPISGWMLLNFDDEEENMLEYLFLVSAMS